MKTISSIWQFSRPHTVIGSIVSILTLYVIICEKHPFDHIPLLVAVLIIGIATNIFIVGINQVADIEIDKINKPHLPIPAGTMSKATAIGIVLTCLLVSLGISLFISHWLFYIVLMALLTGWAYSMPPLHFKKHHITAALSILLVRGILINIFAFMVFNQLINRTYALPVNLILLSAFIIVFSLVIAWFKDLPDVEGDSAYGIRTLALVYSLKKVFIAGNLLVIVAYIVTLSILFTQWKTGNTRIIILFTGHLILLILFIANMWQTRILNQRSVSKFYKRFWFFFFAEYVLFFMAHTLAAG
jgi:homogentisate phytyltransferase/homogentisate geranylgeranyltransferase